MKKRIGWMIVAAGLFLLAACGPDVEVTPTATPTMEPTAGAMLDVTVEPTAGAMPDVTIKPTTMPTAALEPSTEPTAEPTATPTTEPTAEPTATPTTEPSQEPTATPTTEPSQKPTATPTTEPSQKPTATPTTEPSQEPTATPTTEPDQEPTATVTPMPTATPTVPPTPTVAPETYVLHGWQKTESITGSYQIIFPEIFDRSEVKKDGQEFWIVYTSTKDDAISFYIGYTMKRTLEEQLELLTEDAILLGQSPEEKWAQYLVQDETTMYQGIVLEEQYGKELLGTAFGEEESIAGILQVIFAFPKDRVEYTAEQYYFYVDAVPLP